IICSCRRARANGCSFFFHAEDGIRDLYVTGVQTCALPIYSTRRARTANRRVARAPLRIHVLCRDAASAGNTALLRIRGVAEWSRSEERRVGKECRAGWGAEP